MTDKDSTLGLILDGGLARRMGGADKGLVALGGKPMLMHVVERLGPQCGALALSANGDPERFAGLGLAVLADDPPGFLGPLAGILAGLDACLARVPRLTHVASLPADTPFAPLDFVGRLHAVRRAAAPKSPSPRRAGAGIISPRSGRLSSRPNSAARFASRAFARSRASPRAIALPSPNGRASRSIRSSTSMPQATSKPPRRC